MALEFTYGDYSFECIDGSFVCSVVDCKFEENYFGDYTEQLPQCNSNSANDYIDMELFSGENNPFGRILFLEYSNST